MTTSNLIGRSASGQYNVNMNNGLYSRLQYKTGNVICNFVGEVVVIAKLRSLHKDFPASIGYSVVINSMTVFYCYDKACMGIYANSPFNARFIDTNQAATSNCLINGKTVDGKYILQLIAATDIWPNTELLWMGYGFGKVL